MLDMSKVTIKAEMSEERKIRRIPSAKIPKKINYFIICSDTYGENKYLLYGDKAYLSQTYYYHSLELMLASSM